MTDQKNKEVLPAIEKKIELKAPIQKVWEAVATAEGIEAWFMPNDFKAELGHQFHIESPFGPSPCKVIELDAPHKLSFTWDVSGWVVTFLLNEVDGKTEFTLIHAGWGEAGDIIEGPGLPQKDIRDRMNHGWDAIVFEALRKVVEE